jgi:hypothetical protein
MSSLATSSPHPPSDIDAVAGVLIDLVEADLVGLGRGWIERCGTRHERKPQKPFQFARGAMDGNTPDTQSMEATDSRRLCMRGSDVPPALTPLKLNHPDWPTGVDRLRLCSSRTDKEHPAHDYPYAEIRLAASIRRSEGRRAEADGGAVLARARGSPLRAVRR